MEADSRFLTQLLSASSSSSSLTTTTTTTTSLPSPPEGMLNKAFSHLILPNTDEKDDDALNKSKRAKAAALGLSPSSSSSKIAASASSSSKKLVPLKKKPLSLRRRHPDRMSCAQETANALTQLGPSIICGLHAYCWRGPRNTPPHAWWVVYAVWLHLPFSFYYHALCAIRSEDNDFDRLKCAARRLDNTFIHVSSAGIAYGTSLGSKSYLVACVAFNLLAASLHWRKEVHADRNQKMTLVAIMLYVAPVIRRGDVLNLSGAFFGLVPAALCFKTYFFGGYSHAIFHVLMTVFALFVLNAANAE